jgi:hypothetical protein
MESYIMDAEKTIVEQIRGYRLDGSEELEERLAQLEAAYYKRSGTPISPFARMGSPMKSPMGV